MWFKQHNPYRLIRNIYYEFSTLTIIEPMEIFHIVTDNQIGDISNISIRLEHVQITWAKRNHIQCLFSFNYVLPSKFFSPTEASCNMPHSVNSSNLVPKCLNFGVSTK